MSEERRSSSNRHLQGINKELGEIKGELKSTHAHIIDSLQAIRDDIKRIETSTNDRITRLESNIDNKFSSVNGRILSLEKEDAQLAVKVAKIGTISGVVSGAIVAAAVEFLKRV